MPGPSPKYPHARRRRNVPGGGEWVDLVPLDRPVLDELPRRRGEADWREWTRAVWESWRQDPVTAQWSQADVAYAIDTARLIDASAHNPRAAYAAEIRLRMDGLGLTPKGKRALRWRIVERQAEVFEHPTARTSAKNARRRRLMAVDPITNGDNPA